MPRKNKKKRSAHPKNVSRSPRPAAAAVAVASDEKRFWPALARALNYRVPVLVVVVWAFMYLPRPFKLGFYCDDWYTLVEPTHATAPFSLARFGQFVGVYTNDGSRPVAGVLEFLLSSAFGSSAMAFQWAGIVFVLIAALSLRSLLNGLLAAFCEYRSLAADWAAVFWMAMPWMLAATAWPQMVHGLLAQILFTEAARTLAHRGPLTAKVVVRFALVLMASTLAYEAFYFQIFLVIGLWAFWPGVGRHGRRETFMLTSIACIAQAIAISLNRYVAHLDPSSSKTLNVQWRSLLLANSVHFPAVLRASLSDYGSLWTICVYSLLAIALCLVVMGMIRKSQRSLAKAVLLVLLLAVVSFGISTTVYSLAGYGFTHAGIESRSLFPASLALSIALFGLLACSMVRANAVLKGGLVLPAIGIVVTAAVAQHATLQDWAYVWQQERRIVAAAPVNEISRLPTGSSILYVGPSYYRNLVIFGASWDLTYAVFSRKPLSENRKPDQGVITIHPATDLYKWSWDGSYLTQDLPGYWTQKSPVAHLYVWDYTRSRLNGVGAGFKWPPS